MAGKAKKKPAKMANRNIGGPQAGGDDGQRFTVVDASGARVYAGGGVALAEAIRLATSLVIPAGVARLEPDGTVTRGRVDPAGQFTAVGGA
jgi:hypothetical protein